MHLLTLLFDNDKYYTKLVVVKKIHLRLKLIKLFQVDDIDLGYKSVRAFALCSDNVPIVAASAYLLSVATTKGAGTAKTYASHLKGFFTAIENISEDVFSYWLDISDSAMSGYFFGVLKQQKRLKKIIYTKP